MCLSRLDRPERSQDDGHQGSTHEQADRQQPTNPRTYYRLFRAATGACFLSFFDVMAYLRRIPPAFCPGVIVFQPGHQRGLEFLELFAVVRGASVDAENCAVDSMLARSATGSQRLLNQPIIRVWSIACAASRLDLSRTSELKFRQRAAARPTEVL